ncbi:MULTISPECIES: branched-chain amino acid ABC transporter permease [Salinibaculum]|uniref:branched-chain amino acid ABC transporter permease n=1 Tax=Salinibaculum TaxID=2732368 RepID=UPI0030D1808A
MSNPLFLDPTVLAQLVVLGVLLGGIYGFVALGLTIIFGVMEVVNVAHGAFTVVGMYTVWYVSNTLGLSPLLGIPAAAVVLFALGVLIQRTAVAPVMDGPESGKFLVTIAVLIILVALVEIQFTATPRQLDVDLGSTGVRGVYVPDGQLYALAVAAVTFAAVWLFLQRTHTGRTIRGTADSRLSAAYVGVDVARVDALTFGLGAGLAGLAGALITFVQPFDPYLGNEYLTIAFVVVVLGGLGSIPGTVVGGLLVGLLHVFGSFYLPGSWNNVLILLVFIAVLLVRPTGLFGGSHD